MILLLSVQFFLVAILWRLVAAQSQLGWGDHVSSEYVVITWHVLVKAGALTPK